jgi:hypothetical protein
VLKYQFIKNSIIEFDEGYFTIESIEIEQEKGIRGLGAVGKQTL